MSMTRSNERRELDAPGRVLAVQGYMDEETGEYIRDKGRTKQEFADSTNINNIINQVMQTGDTQWMQDHKAWLESATDTAVPNVDYKELMDIVATGESRFNELPSDVRNLFENDTAKFLNFCQAPDGMEKLQQMITEAKKPVKKAGSARVGSDPDIAAGGTQPAVSPDSGGDGGDPG